MPLRQITAAEYRRIRQWIRRMEIAAAVPAFVLAILVAWLKLGGNPQMNDAAFNILIACVVVSMLLPVLSAYHFVLAMFWRCPHCGNEFTGRRGRLRAECHHCGVSLDELEPS
jgi:hypothetical protein